MASTSGSSNDRSGGGPSEEQTVICSICLEVVETSGPKDSVRLRCGHLFHFDCITSAFSAKGKKQCPNCRDVTGNWSAMTILDQEVQELLQQTRIFVTDFIGRVREITEQDQVNWDARVQEQQLQAQENEWQERIQDLQAQRQELVRSQERMQEHEARMREQIAHEIARINQYWTAQIEQERAHTAQYWTAQIEQERANTAQYWTAQIEQERAHTAQYWTVRIEQERARIAQYYSTIYGRTSLPPNSVLSNSFTRMPAPTFRLIPELHFEPMSPTLTLTRSTAFEWSTSTKPAIASAAMDSRVPDDIEAEGPPHH